MSSEFHLERRTVPAEAPVLAALPMSARLLKAVLDRTAALLLLVLTAPLLVVLAVAVRRDGGPALVREARVNARGCVVGLLRFRVTGPDGDTTRIGELMRRHGLDGLPQLLNVLSGSLALVGPRPLVVGDGQMPPLVTPGLTGLASKDRIDGAELESRYAERWSPTLDVRLLARALRSACRRVSR
jgi:lipopolysaccharide/colanic/teichoic acid biosynthesis glycosyltransferase